MARATAYLNDIAQHDFVEFAGARRDPRRILAYLRSAAAMIAQPASLAAIGRRIEEVTAINLGATAAPVAHDWATRLFLVEDEPAWSPRLRSRAQATATPTRQVVGRV